MIVKKRKEIAEMSDQAFQLSENGCAAGSDESPHVAASHDLETPIDTWRQLVLLIW